jgi:hypothetical protein
MMAMRVIPPSVLPDISPSRGESDSPYAPNKPLASSFRFVQRQREAECALHLLSPLEGEMPGRAEGGEFYPMEGRHAA